MTSYAEENWKRRLELEWGEEGEIKDVTCHVTNCTKTPRLQLSLKVTVLSMSRS